jgi:membrane protein YqaA with SNARE-associated domain
MESPPAFVGGLFVFISMEEWTLIGLFVSSFLAATVLPFSSEAVFLGLLGAGFGPVACIAVATCGNTLGGLTNLLLGRFSRGFYERRGKTLKGEGIIRKYGAWTAWLSWVPVIGDPLLIAAGFYRTPFLVTVLFMLLGKCGRYFVLWYFFSLTQ